MEKNIIYMNGSRYDEELMSAIWMHNRSEIVRATDAFLYRAVCFTAAASLIVGFIGAWLA